MPSCCLFILHVKWCWLTARSSVTLRQPLTNRGHLVENDDVLCSFSCIIRNSLVLMQFSIS
jgi:hypothetical protein